MGRDEFDGFTTAQRLAFLDRLLVHAEGTTPLTCCCCCCCFYPHSHARTRVPGLVARTPRAFINPHVLNQMDHMYKLTETKNAEVRHQGQRQHMPSSTKAMTNPRIHALCVLFAVHYYRFVSAGSGCAYSQAWSALLTPWSSS